MRSRLELRHQFAERLRDVGHVFAGLNLDYSIRLPAELGPQLELPVLLRLRDAHAFESHRSPFLSRHNFYTRV